MTNRERASAFADPLDLSGFEPKAGKPPIDKLAVREAANRAGFVTKHAPVKAVPISGRSLRRSNKTAQLNVAVSEITRERFWTLAQEYDCGTGEELITMLLDKFARKRSARLNRAFRYLNSRTTVAALGRASGSGR